MKAKSTLRIILFVFAINIEITANAQAVNVQDSLALVDLYNSTNGPGWTNHTNWLSGPVNTWYGITVEDTRVTIIDMYFNNLYGTIPASLGNLTNLTILFLPYGQLSGNIPPELGNLVNLKNLYLGGNQLSGNLPPELGKLTNLVFLDLFSNHLNGSIPPEIGSLPNVAIIQLFDNQLSGTIPAELGNLTKLENLNLSFNQLSGSIPDELGNLAKINPYSLYFDLSNNQLSGSIPTSLGKLINLTHLDLGNNQLTGSIPSQLSNLVNLDYLNVSNNKLGGHIVSAIGNLKNLNQLYLEHNKFNGNIPSVIADLPLNELNLSYNRFTFDGIELVAQTFPFAIYSDQARIRVEQKGNTLSISAGGTLSNNRYEWSEIKRDEKTTISGDSVFYPTKNGLYRVKVYNSTASQLVIKSDTILYVNPNAIATSGEEIQLQAKTMLFSVYPNPAKDILHIQINGIAMVSLVDQSGKILRTATINNSGSIGLSNFPPGLYYLKNNTTGEMKKIIINK